MKSMFRPPSIRNFAVSRLASIRFWGSVWIASDRRDHSQYWVIRTSKLVAWPRLMAALTEFTPLAVRSRTNQVLVVIPGNQSLKHFRVEIRKLLKQHVRFDPLKGFEKTRNSAKYLVLVLIASGLILLLIQGFSPTQNDQPANHTACNTSPALGSKAFVAQTVAELVLDGIVFERQSIRRIGGLVQMKVTRKCDLENFNLQFWSQGGELILSKVS